MTATITLTAGAHSAEADDIAWAREKAKHFALLDAVNPGVGGYEETASRITRLADAAEALAAQQAKPAAVTAEMRERVRAVVFDALMLRDQRADEEMGMDIGDETALIVDALDKAGLLGEGT